MAAPRFNQHGGRVQPGFQLIVDSPGPVYYTLDGSDPRQSALLPGGTVPGIAPQAQLYTGPFTLQHNALVKARTLVDGQWSALTEAPFVLTTLPLRISEIMYHPRTISMAACGRMTILNSSNWSTHRRPSRSVWPESHSHKELRSASRR